ncbi:patatin family protein [Salinicoccus hispanicus]|uniref:Patatin family protein n=1 Tax=Salinicoccus hispanicus TaxID=157225 RepID=A0A6N8U1W1_9STAP|nr:patatin family protein [Salinicoccus hispanicus]MXQ52054.1 patatin family protein [Salinicoccus hispanicus]
MTDAGLVLEGGGMRGLYTAGVLEYFMSKELYFPYVIGVSAGACMGASYLARQRGRNRKVNLDFLEDKRYLSFSNYIKKREVFGMDFIFDEIPNKLVPFDVKTLMNGPEEFVIGATDCESGDPVYFKKSDYDETTIARLLRASSSLPFVASSVQHNGQLLLDGGISDPIPIKKAESDGFELNIVVLTKPRGYFKKPGKMSKIIKYKDHPIINDKLGVRYKHYNQTLHYITRQEKAGKAFVISPSQDIKVGRTEKNRERLESLYELGWNDAKAQYEKMRAFLGSMEKQYNH